MTQHVGINLDLGNGPYPDMQGRGLLQAWRLTGDEYAKKPGDKPWISEMYGYVFSAAKHNMWHQIDRLSMVYPDYAPIVPPKLLHYGLTHKVKTKNSGTWAFDKHWYSNFNPYKCPPWKLDKDSKGGMFYHPPSPSDLVRRVRRCCDALLCAPHVLVRCLGIEQGVRLVEQSAPLSRKLDLFFDL